MQVQQVMFRRWIKFHNLLHSADKAPVVLSALFNRQGLLSPFTNLK